MSNFQMIYDQDATTIYELYQQLGSINAILRYFKVNVRDPRCRKHVSDQIELCTGNDNHRYRQSYASLCPDHVRKIAEEATSITTLCEWLGWRPIGSNFTTIRRFLEEHQIPLAKRPQYPIWSDEAVYCENSQYYRQGIHKRVKRDNWMPYECAFCSNPGMWFGKPMALQIDHINGISNDHRKENLRWLCPNCHAQTPTYCGRNKQC